MSSSTGRRSFRYCRSDQTADDRMNIDKSDRRQLTFFWNLKGVTRQIVFILVGMTRQYMYDRMKKTVDLLDTGMNITVFE
jgi:hypothetical protein